MAPRSDFALDYSSSSSSNNNKNYIHFGNVEFKPRVGAWASFDTWTSPSKVDKSGVGRRRVRFARHNDIQDYVSRSEYTRDEKLACWFRRSEYKSMRAHNTETVHKMTHRIPLNEQTECVFGLECQTPMESFRCHQVMRCSLLAVLEEQDDQLRYDGCINDSVLAARYSSCTVEAKDRALWLGQSHKVFYDEQFSTTWHC